MAPRPSYITVNNAVNRSNNNNMDDDVISSLGKVLSSVNLVGEDNRGSGSYGGTANGQQHQHNMHAQQQGGQGDAFYGSNSWNGTPMPSGSGTPSSG